MKSMKGKKFKISSLTCHFVLPNEMTFSHCNEKQISYVDLKWEMLTSIFHVY